MLRMNPIITYQDFEKIDIRVGAIIEVKDFPEARKSAYQLKIDFGSELGIKSSSVQITHLYQKDELIGKQVICVVNFPAKKIGPFLSEVLTTGFDNENGVVLTSVDKPVKNGMKMY